MIRCITNSNKGPVKTILVQNLYMYLAAMDPLILAQTKCKLHELQLFSTPALHCMNVTMDIENARSSLINYLYQLTLLNKNGYEDNTRNVQKINLYGSGQYGLVGESVIDYRPRSAKCTVYPLFISNEIEPKMRFQAIHHAQIACDTPILKCLIFCMF